MILHEKLLIVQKNLLFSDSSIGALPDLAFHFFALVSSRRQETILNTDDEGLQIRSHGSSFTEEQEKEDQGEKEEEGITLEEDVNFETNPSNQLDLSEEGIRKRRP